MPINPLDQYKEQAVTTATPGMLIVKLFDGAIKNIKLAIKAVQDRKIEEAHNAIMKAEDIYSHLLSTLNENVPISANLKQLYEYLLNRLIEANFKKDAEILNEVLDFTIEFRETWNQAEKNIHIQSNNFQNDRQNLNVDIRSR